MKDIEPSIANFEIIRNDKIREFGQSVKNEQGNIVSYEIPQDDEAAVQKFRESLEELLNTDAKITIHKLKAGEVFDKGLSAEYLVNLYPIIEE